jgi:outer membrane protein TolC
MIRTYALLFGCVILALGAGAALAQEAPAPGMPAKMALTIPEAINLAWNNNIVSIRQQDALQQAQARRREARSTYLPELSMNLQYSKSNNPQLSFFNDEVFETTNSYNLGFTLSQPIFDGFNYIHTPKARSADIHSSEAALRNTRQGVAFDAKRLCYDLLKAQRLSDVQQRAVERSQEQLETSKARYELGSASMSDYLKSKVQLGRDSLTLITRENNIEIARATLNDFLGLPVSRRTEVDVQLEFEPYPLPDEGALLASVSTHPYVMAATYAEEAASHEVGSSQSVMWPRLDAFARYSYFTGKFPESADDIWRADNHTVGLSLNWTIFSGFATSSRVKQAKINRHTFEEELVQAQRTVSLAITTSALRVSEAQKRFTVAEDQVESAQEDLDIAQEKYNLGAATILDILTAQVSLSEAETERIQAGYDFFLSIAELERAMGGGD